MQVNNKTFQALLQMLNEENNKIENKELRQADEILADEKVVLPSSFSNKIFDILKQFTPRQQKTIIETWQKQNLPLTAENLEKILELLYYNPDSTDNRSEISRAENMHSLIKAVSLLLKNKVPIFPQLISALKTNLNPQQTLSEIINNMTSEQNNKSNNISINIKQLQFHPESQTPEQLAYDLNNYTADLKDILFQTQEGQTQTQENIYEQLLGQQIINNTSPSTLLSLELPIFFSQFNKTIPAYLHISNYEEISENKNNTNNQNAFENDKTFKITFIISLPNKGTIRSDIIYNSSSIKSLFFCEKKNTADLIKKRFPEFKEKLLKKGYTAAEPEIKISPEINPGKNDINKKNSTDSRDKYQHIDFKV